MGSKSAEKLRIQLIEADVEIGFGLIDDARFYRASGQPEYTSRALSDASAVVADIETRTQQLDVHAAQPFFPLVAELRYELDLVKQETS